jgi:DNA-binding NarL/FixJ family response regulator
LSIGRARALVDHFGLASEVVSTAESAMQGFGPTSSESAQALAEFSLAGQSCFIVLETSLSERRREAIIGSVTVDGHRYAICSRLKSDAAPLPDPIDLLTARELEIAVLIAQGCHNKEIARRLGISPFTVGAHLARAFTKLGVSCRSALTARIVGRIGMPLGS